MRRARQNKNPAPATVCSPLRSTSSIKNKKNASTIIFLKMPRGGKIFPCYDLSSIGNFAPTITPTLSEATEIVKIFLFEASACIHGCRTTPCANMIRDYFICRDENPVLQLFNTCAPLKEQFCACINEVFVKNHERGDKKFNANRDQFFQAQKEKRFEKLLNQVEETIELKTKLQD
ncbi:hypothetical protein AGDE_02571 [Angomonas deanei]|nr:hypothetical protein AGDE_02571 [Angomonas deanei]|eukprot:EPY41354.1 hypothetical protein AGDE_02571 [Angomonas deanei]